MRLIPRRRAFSASSDSSVSTINENTMSASTSTAANTEGEGSKPVNRSQRPRYESPLVDGRCMLLECPDEVLGKIFSDLDRGTFTKCLRLCKRINDLLSTDVKLQLHYTLQCQSLALNHNIFIPSSNINLVPPTPARLLNDLRERITRFHNFTPKSRQTIPFGEPEGRLYEFLEGILLRGVSPGGVRGSRALPREVAVYDLRRLGDWEDLPSAGGEGSGSGPEAEDEIMEEEEADESIVDGDTVDGETVRTIKKFDFEVAEFAVDPGQDLLVVVEVRTQGPGRYTMHFHFVSLSTHKPHPKATSPVLDWPTRMPRRNISLSFQICDDAFMVLNQRQLPEGPQDQLYGWQWTTGRLAVTLRAPPTMSFESFVMLTPWSFVVPTIVTHLDLDSPNQGDPADPSDLSWTHHLYIYAFPPMSSTKVKQGEPVPPHHTAVHIKTLDLPNFLVDIPRLIPPPRLSIRSDPPPRHQLPTHPEGMQVPFQPTPESGILIIEVYCQMPDRMPHYQIITLKSTLAQYLPSPDSSLLRTAFSRPAVPVSWAELAPKVRMWGPDLDPSPWVCYVYQNRYVSGHTDESLQSYWRIYDFDPLRTRKLVHERQSKDAKTPFAVPPRKPVWHGMSDDGVFHSSAGRLYEYDPTWPQDGERDGIYLYQKETVIKGEEPLLGEIRTGSEFPYICSERETADFGDRSGDGTLLLDDSRVVIIKRDDPDSDSEDEQPRRPAQPVMEVMEF